MTTAMTDAPATVKVALHCADCGSTGERYVWRYFEGECKGQTVTLCLACYNIKLTWLQPLSLMIGQKIPDRRWNGYHGTSQ